MPTKTKILQDLQHAPASPIFQYLQCIVPTHLNDAASKFRRKNILRNTRKE